MLLHPLVTIGIPTYNRSASLKCAIESALSQDYSNLNILISDNASTDDTELICRVFCENDKRIKYIKQQFNIGATANFMEVLNLAEGMFFMWLSDDDWLEKSYISECVKVLISNPDYSLVAGRCKYFSGTKLIFQESNLNLLQNSNTSRILSYYSNVTYNGIFYGLMRLDLLSKANLKKTMGSDWLLIASIAFSGKIVTIPHTYINRTLNSTKNGYKRIGKSLKLSGLQFYFQVNFPFISIAISAFKDILWNSYFYKEIKIFPKTLLAIRVFITILYKNYRFKVFNSLKIFYLRLKK